MKKELYRGRGLQCVKENQNEVRKSIDKKHEEWEKLIQDIINKKIQNGSEGNEIIASKFDHQVMKQIALHTKKRKGTSKRIFL